MLSIVFFFIHVFFALAVFYLTVSFFTGGPFVPSRKKSVEKMIELAYIKPGMVVYDLGSGDGRILREAQKYGAKAIGIEMNPFLILFCKMKKLHVRWQNLWTSDIHDADVVFVYLLPINMKKLGRKLQTELRKGALVVSNSFIFPNWKILRQDVKSHTYVFRVI